MAEVGFGNPGSSSFLITGTIMYVGTQAVTTVYDQGFGDKTALFSDFSSYSKNITDSFSQHQTDEEYQFTGFGDPSPDFLQLPFIADGLSEFPDEGGVLIVLEGTFSSSTNYRFQLIGKDGTKYPSSTTFCSAAKAGKGSAVSAFRADSRVAFAMPPVPPGSYDIQMEYGQDFGLQLLLVSYVKVIRKNRSTQTYSLRTNYPELFTVGARNHLSDKKEMGGGE